MSRSITPADLLNTDSLINFQKWCRVKDSNLQPSRSERNASPNWANAAAKRGTRNAECGNGNPASSRILIPRSELPVPRFKLVLPAGLPPATSAFEARRSGNCATGAKWSADFQIGAKQVNERAESEFGAPSPAKETKGGRRRQRPLGASCASDLSTIFQSAVPPSEIRASPGTRTLTARLKRPPLCCSSSRCVGTMVAVPGAAPDPAGL